MQFGKVTLVGVGLLGGSLGRALRTRKLAHEVVGFVRRSQAAADCAQVGATDYTTANLYAAVTNADLVVLCTPLGQMAPITRQFLSVLKPQAVVTDVGSTKADLVAELEPLLAGAGAAFVGSHPLAGGEKTGVLAARADLFEGATCVVTPTPRTDPAALQRVSSLWSAVGGTVLSLTPAAHDEFVSRSSHLPHVVAAELANYVLSPAHSPLQAQLCATGFRDTTRIASGSPEMWRDIALSNRAALSRVLSVFIEGLEEFRHSLDSSDAAGLLEYFAQAKSRRDAWSQLNESASTAENS